MVKFLLLVLILCLPPCHPVDISAQDVASFINQTRGALVLLRVKSKHATGSATLGYGTGWLVTYDGWAITARHVIEGGSRKLDWDRIHLEADVWGLPSGATAEVIKKGTEEFQDAALIKINLAGIDNALNIFENFDYGRPQLGSEITTLGFIDPNKREPDQITSNVSKYGSTSFFGDKPVAAGLSGGPALVTRNGVPHVVGMTLAAIKDQGLSPVLGEYIPLQYIQSLINFALSNGVRTSPKPNLPDRPTALYRDNEIDRVLQALKSTNAALILAPPGLEAREMAIEIAYRAWEQWKLQSSNVIYVTAENQDGKPRGFAEIVEILLRAIGRGAMSNVLESARVDFLKTILLRDKYLIVLNNVNEDSLLDEIFSIRGNASLLVTGPRSLMGSQGGSHIERIKDLSPDKCVSLFRAEQGEASNKLTSDTDIGGICTRLGGMPQAIRALARTIKAGRQPFGAIRKLVRSRDLADISQLDALRKTLTLAFNQMNKKEKSAFLALAAVEGESFDKATASALMRAAGIDSDAVDYYREELLANNFITTYPEERFRIQPLIRQTLNSSAPSRETDDAKRRMIFYYLGEFGLTPAQFHRDWDNLTAALDRCNELPDQHVVNRCLVEGVPRLAPIMRYLRHWSLHQKWVSKWLEVVRFDKDLNKQRAALTSLAEVALDQRNMEKAEQFLVEARSLTPDVHALDMTALYYADARLHSESPPQTRPKIPGAPNANARELILKGIDIAKNSKASPQRLELLARGFLELAILAASNKDHKEAREQLQQCLDAAVAHNLSFFFISCYQHLGTIFLEDNDFENAEKSFGKALEKATNETFHEFRGRILLLLGRVALRRGEKDTARGLINESISVFRSIGSQELDHAEQLLRSI